MVPPVMTKLLPWGVTDVPVPSEAGMIGRAEATAVRAADSPRPHSTDILFSLFSIFMGVWGQG